MCEHVSGKCNKLWPQIQWSLMTASTLSCEDTSSGKKKTKDEKDIIFRHVKVWHPQPEMAITMASFTALLWISGTLVPHVLSSIDPYIDTLMEDVPLQAESEDVFQVFPSMKISSLSLVRNFYLFKYFYCLFATLTIHGESIKSNFRKQELLKL